MAGRRKTLVEKLAQIVVATAAGLAWMVAPSQAGDPAPSSGSIYGGQWSCEFRRVTRPAGTFVQTLGFLSSIENELFVAVKSSFQVDKNGSFSWEERKNSSCRGDTSYYLRDGKTTSDSFDMAAVLKVAGQVADAKTRAAGPVILPLPRNA